MTKELPLVAAVILAGGEGKRLFPLTLHHSKPAISYGGRYRLIDIPISNAIHSGLRQIFVIAQYLSAELQHHISQTYHFDRFHPGFVDVLTPEQNEKGEQEWFLGTADAVRKNLPTLLKSEAEIFLILAGDQLYNINFQELIVFAQEKEADLTIAAISVSEADARRMGLLKIDSHHQVIDFCEKPNTVDRLKKFLQPETEKEATYLGSMGIYVFKKEALVSLLKEDLREDFGFHLIDTAVKKRKTTAFIYDGYWEDIGTVGAYYRANLQFAQSMQGLNAYDTKKPIYSQPTYLPGPRIIGTKIFDSMLSEGCFIEAEEIRNSLVGPLMQIGKKTIIRDSVILGNSSYLPPLSNPSSPSSSFGIGENCLIEKAIIDEHVRIGNNVRLINQGKRESFDGEFLFVREGIIIILKNSIVPDGFEF